MKYKVGDVVVLRDELQHSGIPDIMKGEKLEISGYYQNLYSTEEGWHIGEDRIDHEKTAELKEERYRQQMYEIQQQENEAEGYTVEEKGYRVILETRDMDKEKDFLGMYPEGKWYVHLDSCFEITGTGLKHTIESFTEQEIKDFDERYWAFAEPVEEEEDV